MIVFDVIHALFGLDTDFNWSEGRNQQLEKNQGFYSLAEVIPMKRLSRIREAENDVENIDDYLKRYFSSVDQQQPQWQS